MRLGDIKLAILKQFNCRFSLSINMQHLRSMLPSSLEQARSHLPEDMLLKNVKSVMLQSDRDFGGFFGDFWSPGIWRM